MSVMQAALFGTGGLTLAVLDLATMGGQLESSMRNLSVYLTTHMNTSACKSISSQDCSSIWLARTCLQLCACFLA
jgi:hypothetical protein